MSDRAIARALVWFRRDLRDFDHAALAARAPRRAPVYCAFVFDREILDALPTRADRRVEFIRESVVELDAALRARGGGLIVRHAHARAAIPELAAALGVEAVYANHDYEPAARDRDAAVARALADLRHLVPDPQGPGHLRARRDDDAGRHAVLRVHAVQERVAQGADARPPAIPPGGAPRRRARRARPRVRRHALARGARVSAHQPRGARRAHGHGGGAALFADFRERIDRYRDARDFPAAKGPSYLSVHLRFGTVSIRELAAFAHMRSLEADGEGAATWLSELIWREFYAQILWHHPHVVAHAFKPEYDALAFPNDPAKFAAWCDGRTGYPIVDAAMRQLNATGYMHNRLRMIAASFLVKDLLVDWRRGERYFADTLLDFDLASNNGGWQWAASTGCDAQPYFRIFNPVTQSERFDPDGKFIRRYVPELAALDAKEIHAPWLVPPAVQRAKGVVVGRDYPAPIVDHAAARTAALALFKAAR